MKYFHFSSILRYVSPAFRAAMLAQRRDDNALSPASKGMNVTSATVKRWQKKERLNRQVSDKKQALPQQTYTATVRDNALKRLQTGKSVRQVAKEMGIPPY